MALVIKVRKYVHVLHINDMNVGQHIIDMYDMDKNKAMLWQISKLFVFKISITVYNVYSGAS